MHVYSLFSILGIALVFAKTTAFPDVVKEDVIQYLARISGANTISGQHNREPNSDPTKWTRVVRDMTGKLPGLWGGDFLFLPDDVRDRQSIITEAINQWNAGSLVALTWHVCPPTVGETCNWDSDGILGYLNDVQWESLITPGGDLNTRWKARLDTIVPFLRQLEAAGVVAIWRPIHEMNEGWSWWGGRPGSNGSLKLYQITYDHLTFTRNLRSLIWTWNVKDVQMASIGNYWPGNSYVDVASLDMWMSIYPTDSDYQRLLAVAGGKPIALAEVGSVPTPELLGRQPRWAWFMVWAEYLKDPAFNTDASVQACYYSPRVFSQGNLDIPTGPGTNNWALKRPTYTSSQETVEFGPEKAVDGDLRSRWSSDLESQQWIYVDLGQTRNVGQIRLVWEEAYAKGYQIQTSQDNQQWTTVYENYNAVGGAVTINIVPTSARYVKMYAFEKGTEYGYSLFEFEVYAPQ